MADSAVVGGLDSTIIGATTATKVTALNPSLFQSATFLKALVGGLISLFVVIATIVTAVVIGLRAKYNPPGAHDDSYTTYKNVAINMTVLANDTVEEGLGQDVGSVDYLEVSAIKVLPLHGKARIVFDREIEYTPDFRYIGVDSLVYTVTNGKKEADAKVTITILNHPPEPVDDKGENNEGIPVQKNVMKQIMVLENDKDIDNDELFVVSVEEQDELGTVYVSADHKAIEYHPNKNKVGVSEFLYYVSDGNDTASATVKVNIKNDPPVPIKDSFNCYRNTKCSMDVLANDYDPNNDPIKITETQGQEHGQIVINQPNLTYTPNWGYTGGDSFEYSITDGIEDENGTVVTRHTSVILTVQNRPPYAYDDGVDVPKNSRGINILKREKYGDKDDYTTLEMYLEQPLKGARSRDPIYMNKGTAELMVSSVEVFFTYNGEEKSYFEKEYQIMYTPYEDTLGEDYVYYTVSDGNLTATGRITVRIMNSPPTAVDDYIEVPRGGSFEFDPVANDIDENGDTIELVKSESLNPTNGLAFYSSENKITYRPIGNFFGEDSFTYYIRDVCEDSKVSSGTVHVKVVNYPPVPRNDRFTVPKNVAVNLNVLLNDTDPNLDPLQITSVNENPLAPLKGTKTITTTSNQVPVIRYVPVSKQVYTETFTYTVSDGDPAFQNINAEVTVQVKNSRPIGKQDNVITHWNKPIDINVVVNDFDENGDELMVLNSFIQEPLSYENTLTLVNSTTVRYLCTYNKSDDKDIADYMRNKLRFDPPPSTPYDLFFYTVTDGDLYSDITPVYVYLQNNPPVTQPDTYSVPHSYWKELRILDNDVDEDGDAMYIWGCTPVSKGNLVLWDNKKGLTYLTPANWVGTVTVKCYVDDGAPYYLPVEEVVTIQITNTPPVANDDEFTFGRNDTACLSGWDLNVLSNDYDPDPTSTGIPAPVLIDNTYIPQSSKATITISEDRKKLHYKPTSCVAGTDTFTYKVTDGLDSSVANVKINLVVNQPPVGNPDSFNVHWRSSGVTKNVLANDQPGDVSYIFVKSVSQGSKSLSVTKVSDTSIKYVPNPAASLGVDKFSYVLSDGSVDLTVSVTATITNTPPYTRSDDFSPVHWRSVSTVTFDPLQNDIDYDDDPLTLHSFIQPLRQFGTLTRGTGNNLIFTPNQIDFLGKDNQGEPIATKYGNEYVARDSFSYFATDSKDTILQDNNEIIIIDTLPVAVNDVYTINKNSENNELSVLSNDYDPDPADVPYLKITTISNNVNGVPTPSADSKKIYFTPTHGFSGTASFNYKIFDGQLTSENPATVTINVVNRPPTCSPSSYTMYKSRPPTEEFYNVTNACSDPDSDVVTLQNIEPSEKATVRITSNKVGFTPLLDRSGQTTMQFTASDGTEPVTSTLTVTIVNRAPVVQNLQASFQKGSASMFEYDVIATASDPDNDVLSLVSISTISGEGGNQISPTKIEWPNRGTAEIVNNKLRFTPSPSGYGVLKFTFTVRDSDLDNPLETSATATVTIVGSPPIAVDDSYEVKQNNFVDMYVMNNDYDPDNEPISLPSDWLVSSNIAQGTTLTLLTDAQGKQFIRYDARPSPKVCQNGNFVYKIQSSDGTATATVTIRFVQCICKVPLDVVYDVDGSGSITTNDFKNRVKPFLKNITNKFDIGSGSEQIRVGMVQFASYAQEETSGLLMDKNSMLNEIDAMRQLTGSTNQTGGLYKSHLMLAYGNNQRSNVNKTIIVVTDGQYNRDKNPIDRAQWILGLDGGKWRIIAVAVMTEYYDDTTIKGMTRDPAEDYFLIDDFYKLSDLFDKIVTRTCSA